MGGVFTKLPVGVVFLSMRSDSDSGDILGVRLVYVAEKGRRMS